MAGISRSATTSETRRVEIMETPICLPIRPMKKFSENTKGRKTVMVVSVAASIDRQTSLVP